MRVQNWLTRLVYLFAALAAILWLLGLFSPHGVLFPDGPNFEDILVYQGRFTLFHTAKFFTSKRFSGFAYPGGCAPFYEAFYKTSNPVETYLVLAAIATLLALALTWFYLRRNQASSLFPAFLLLSFPLVFLIQRANIELILWIVVALGIVTYRRGYAIPAAMLFGIAASMKLYPIFLLGLFLKRRRDLPAFAAGLVTAIAAMAFAIEYTGPTFFIATKGFFTGVDRFQDHYVDAVSHVEILFDHCLFSPFKYWAFTHHTSPAPWKSTYYLVAGVLALALYFFRVRILPSLNRRRLLVTAMVALPPVSFTYTLVHLYVPLLLLLGALATTRSRPNPTAVAALACLLFLMLPIVSLNAIQPFPTGPLQACALFALLVLCSLGPWTDTTLALD